MLIPPALADRDTVAARVVLWNRSGRQPGMAGGRPDRPPQDRHNPQVNEMGKKRSDEVFGISNQVRPDSYVDRGSLDNSITRQLERTNHLALRGESKTGKSWLRQKVIPDAIVVQCRLGKSVLDVFTDALSQLDVRLTLEETKERKLKGRAEATTSFGAKLLAKIGVKAALEAEGANAQKFAVVGQDIHDLRFIAQVLTASDRRLVIEDFHYMSVHERKKFAYDLKALWDYGLFVIIIGVWSQSNLLLHLNADLTGRVHEESVYWSPDDLRKVMTQGGSALNLAFSKRFQDKAIEICFGNVGILQTLVLKALDELGVDDSSTNHRRIDDLDALESAAMLHAEQLNPLYLQFASRVSGGIRSRTDATAIYAHAMAAILEEPDDVLLQGVPVSRIFAVTNAREPRIQRGNLRTVLKKFEGLQVDADGRGLVLAYNDADQRVSVVDRQLLLYRRYSTVKWPWEDLIAEAESRQANYEVIEDETDLDE